MSGQGPRDASSSIWLAVERVGLPDKKYFKIGEVASLVGVEPHVLRYWQTQFPQVRPQKSRSGHRLYRRKDVETLLVVRELLHVQRFTIAGARQALRGLVRGERGTTGLPELVDEEAAPPAPTRPYAPPPRAVATEVVAVEVEGLEDDELDDALARQLVSASAQGELATVEVEAAPERPAPAPVTSRAVQSIAVSSSDEPAGLFSAPLAPARAAPAEARAIVDDAVVTAPAALPASPASAAGSFRDRARKEQLGFGFIPSNRGALEAARAEVLAMLDLLDREDAAANRLRARPVAAKT